MGRTFVIALCVRPGKRKFYGLLAGFRTANTAANAPARTADAAFCRKIGVFLAKTQ
jgi:hypothetical protein